MAEMSNWTWFTLTIKETNSTQTTYFFVTAQFDDADI